MNIRWSVLAPVGMAMMMTAVAAAAGRPVNAPQQASTASAFDQELINTEKAFLDAMERGDAEYIKNAVADDFVVIQTNGDSSGKSELVHYVHPQQKREPKPFLYEWHVVQLDQDCAVVTYNAVLHGAPIDRYQHLSDTWVKQGGQWKLKFQQTTVNLWSAHDID
ncbi:MAG TPA: nuclear transport factor 2 family protein [Terriglobales bacterium]|nr:nuclear transport factor 2 family protein [Terriglobales bacterium]